LYLTIEVLESSGMDIEANNIYILDTETIIRQIDLIENCPILNNVIILQTILEEIKNRFPIKIIISKFKGSESV